VLVRPVLVVRAHKVTRGGLARSTVERKSAGRSYDLQVGFNNSATPGGYIGQLVAAE